MPVENTGALNLLEMHARELFLVLEHLLARAGQQTHTRQFDSVYWPECSEDPVAGLRPADVPEFLRAVARALNEVAGRLSR